MNSWKSLSVSNPLPLSNIRLLKFSKNTLINASPSRETKYKKSLVETQEWHHNFWKYNNSLYERRESLFIEQIYKQYSRDPTSMEMSLFYQEYMKSVQGIQARYYRDWNSRNFRNLILGYLASVESLGVSVVDWMRQGWMERSFRAHGVTVR